jgi:hypothetical protein
VASVHVLVGMLGLTPLHAEPPTGEGASFSQGLSVGARLGPIISWIDRDRDPIEDDLYDRFRQFGLAASAVAQLELLPWLTVEFGLSYLPKGERSVLTLNGNERELHMNYLSASLIGSIGPYEYQRFTPYVLWGPALGYLFRCRDVTASGTNGCSTFIETWDIGAVVGIGAALDLSRPGSIVFEARYDHGLRLIDAADGLDHRNRAVLFSIGYSHRIGDH